MLNSFGLKHVQFIACTNGVTVHVFAWRHHIFLMGSACTSVKARNIPVLRVRRNIKGCINNT